MDGSKVLTDRLQYLLMSLKKKTHCPLLFRELYTVVKSFTVFVEITAQRLQQINFEVFKQMGCCLHKCTCRNSVSECCPPAQASSPKAEPRQPSWRPRRPTQQDVLAKGERCVVFTFVCFAFQDSLVRFPCFTVLINLLYKKTKKKPTPKQKNTTAVFPKCVLQAGYWLSVRRVPWSHTFGKHQSPPLGGHTACKVLQKADTGLIVFNLQSFPSLLDCPHPIFQITFEHSIELFLG